MNQGEYNFAFDKGYETALKTIMGVIKKDYTIQEIQEFISTISGGKIE